MDHFEDEKLAIYHKQHDQMGAVFEDARSMRTGLQAEYARRNQLILDLLAEIRADTDTRTRERHNELKAFSMQMDENMDKGNKSLASQLRNDLLVGGKRYSAANKEVTRLDQMIQKEIQDCQEHTIAEVAPIAARLAEHRVNLEAQIVERKEQHEEWCQAVKDSFVEIRERLAAETVERAEELKVIKKKIDEDYVDLNIVRGKADDQLREKVKVVRKALQVQKEDRVKAQTSIVQDMISYMQQFEDAIAAMSQAQADTTQKLTAMKKKTGFAHDSIGE